MGVEWLGCIAGIYWLFKTMSGCFSNACIFVLSTSNVWALKLLYNLTNSVNHQSVILAILKWVCSGSSCGPFWAFTIPLHRYISSSPYWDSHTVYFTPSVPSPPIFWTLSSLVLGFESPTGLLPLLYSLQRCPASCGHVLITCTGLLLFSLFPIFLSHMPILYDF